MCPHCENILTSKGRGGRSWLTLKSHFTLYKQIPKNPGISYKKSRDFDRLKIPGSRDSRDPVRAWLPPLGAMFRQNPKNKSWFLGNLCTKNCGLNAKFENIFKDNPTAHLLISWKFFLQIKISDLFPWAPLAHSAIFSCWPPVWYRFYVWKFQWLCSLHGHYMDNGHMDSGHHPYSPHVFALKVVVAWCCVWRQIQLNVPNLQGKNLLLNSASPFYFTPPSPMVFWRPPFS